MSRIKRECSFFDHNIPLSQQISNGTLFILFLKDNPVIPCNYINLMNKISKYETNIKQILVYLKFVTKDINNK